VIKKGKVENTRKGPQEEGDEVQSGTYTRTHMDPVGWGTAGIRRRWREPECTSSTRWRTRCARYSTLPRRTRGGRCTLQEKKTGRGSRQFTPRRRNRTGRFRSIAAGYRDVTVHGNGSGRSSQLRMLFSTSQAHKAI